MFEVLGLNKYQSKVLYSLIKMGEGTAYEISIDSGVPLGKIYSVLKSLVELGLVEEIFDQKKKYRIKNIESILKLIEEKKKELDKLKKNIEMYRNLYQKSEDVVKVAYGERGFEVLRRETKANEYNYAIKYFVSYDPKIVKDILEAIGRGVKFKTLVKYSDSTKENIEKWKKITPDIRKYDNPGIILNINENFVLIGLPKRNVSILIKDKDFAKVMKDMFEALYEKCEPC